MRLLVEKRLLMTNQNKHHVSHSSFLHIMLSSLVTARSWTVWLLLITLNNIVFFRIPHPIRSQEQFSWIQTAQLAQKKYVTYTFSILTFLLVVGEDGLVRVTISWMASRNLSRCRGLDIPISCWISVSDKAWKKKCFILTSHNGIWEMELVLL